MKYLVTADVISRFNSQAKQMSLTFDMPDGYSLVKDSIGNKYLELKDEFVRHLYTWSGQYNRGWGSVDDVIIRAISPIVDICSLKTDTVLSNRSSMASALESGKGITDSSDKTQIYCVEWYALDPEGQVSRTQKISDGPIDKSEFVRCLEVAASPEVEPPVGGSVILHYVENMEHYRLPLVKYDDSLLALHQLTPGSSLFVESVRDNKDYVSGYFSEEVFHVHSFSNKDIPTWDEYIKLERSGSSPYNNSVSSRWII